MPGFPSVVVATGALGVDEANPERSFDHGADGGGIRRFQRPSRSTSFQDSVCCDGASQK
ncbi:hypothetical protein AGR9A_Lc20153 [Agrobacterium salinitolerans str. Hayward 0363]|nr:hypothetical protein AGR9A_Lc20153 [Agrobacterium salinitolerans str. Hayward 0363]